MYIRVDVCVIKAVNAVEFMDKMNSRGGVNRLNTWTDNKY